MNVANGITNGVKGLSKTEGQNQHSGNLGGFSKLLAQTTDLHKVQKESSEKSLKDIALKLISLLEGEDQDGEVFNDELVQSLLSELPKPMVEKLLGQWKDTDELLNKNQQSDLVSSLTLLLRLYQLEKKGELPAEDKDAILTFLDRNLFSLSKKTETNLTGIVKSPKEMLEQIVHSLKEQKAPIVSGFIVSNKKNGFQSLNEFEGKKFSIQTQPLSNKKEVQLNQLAEVKEYINKINEQLKTPTNEIIILRDLKNIRHILEKMSGDSDWKEVTIKLKNVFMEIQSRGDLNLKSMLKKEINKINSKLLEFNGPVAKKQLIRNTDIERSIILQNTDKNQTITQNKDTKHVGGTVEQLQFRTEHHTITLTSSSKQSMDSQFIDKFQQLLKETNVTTFKGGQSNLVIKLKPDHLGDLTIRLSQVNGELTAKIITTTLAAKELLESNLSQLRQVLGQPSVNIEKLELQLDQRQPPLPSEGQNQNRGQEQQSKQKEDVTSDEEQEEQNDKETFKDVLLNFKV